jgi:hypothetical protein
MANRKNDKMTNNDPQNTTRYTDSDYPFGIFKLLLHRKQLQCMIQHYVPHIVQQSCLLFPQCDILIKEEEGTYQPRYNTTFGKDNTEKDR